MKDPKDYRFCGYAAALVGDEAIRKGLMSFLEATEWPKAAAEYRLLLFVTAGSANASDKNILDPEVIKAELARGGELGLGQVLRLRIRHFTEGVFLGSQEFVNETFVGFHSPAPLFVITLTTTLYRSIASSITLQC